jgi:hypothetical protein
MDSPSFLITLRDGIRFIFIAKVAQRISRFQRKQRGLKSRDRIRRAQSDGRLKTRTKRDIFHDSDGRTRIGHFRFPNPIQRAGSGVRKPHPFVRSAPSFRPDLRTASAVAHSGGQGWPVPTAPVARSVLDGSEHGGTLGRVGDRSTPIPPSKSAHESPSKAEITLTWYHCHRVSVAGSLPQTFRIDFIRWQAATAIFIK